jgi:hypothetical protein
VAAALCRCFLHFDYRLESQICGFALTDGSPYEETINQTLLKARKSGRWQDARNRFFAAE